MNTYQQQLYDNLMSLVETNEAFYYKDFIKSGAVYRILNYRLASYTDFLQPGALECRGIMFEVEHEGRDAKGLRLVSLPMEKFFNLNENPSTMDLDLSEIDLIELKADGSLISTYFHVDANGSPFVGIKSKGSLESDQVYAVDKFLDDNIDLYTTLLSLSYSGFTVNMEWCAPDNRIVIGYEKPHLTVLNIRRNSTGEYIDRHDPEIPDTLREIWVEELNIESPMDEFVAQIPDMTGIEGYVVRLSSGQRVKIKTEWYLTQHRAKDSINSPRRLFEAVIEEATDDLRTLFYDDPAALTRITEMEEFAEGLYNHTVDQIERFYERNKDLERKEYAILGQQELDRRIFGLAMTKYTNKPVDYKAFLRKNWKAFGVKDDPVGDE